AYFCAVINEIPLTTLKLSGEQVATVPGRGEQLGPEIGMGDADQRFGALADVPPPEVGDAVFGDHVVDVTAAGDHAGPLFERRLDAAHRAALGGGRQRDDRPA